MSYLVAGDERGGHETVGHDRVALEAIGADRRIRDREVGDGANTRVDDGDQREDGVCEQGLEVRHDAEGCRGDQEVKLQLGARGPEPSRL